MLYEEETGLQLWVLRPPSPNTILHLSAAKLQENVYIVSILKVVREAHDVAVLQAAVQLNLI